MTTGVSLAGNGQVHGLFVGLGVGAALVFYALEKRRRGLTDSRLWALAAFAIAFGAIGARLLTWDFVQQPSLEEWWVNGDQAAVFGAQAGVGLHPSFVYEIVFHAVAFSVMLRFRDRLGRSGDLFILYVTAYALFRFAVEFVRGNDVLWLGLSGPQWFLLAMLPLLAWRTRKVFAALRPVAEGQTEGRTA